MGTSDGVSAPAGGGELAERSQTSKTPPWWRNPAFLIPTAISLIAVAVAFYSTWDVHQFDRQTIAANAKANAAAAVAAREADANKVSYFVEPGNGQVLVVQNLSQEPVSQAVLWAILDVTAERIPQPPPVDFLLGPIPACHVAYYDLSSPQLLAYVLQHELTSLPQPIGWLATRESGWYWVPDSLYFTDGNGNSWERGTTWPDRPFLKPAQPPGVPPDLADPQATSVTPATGCS